LSKILPLILKDVCYRVGGDRLIQNINLRFEAGPITLVIGPNGAGKSLLLRLCHGLIAPESGSITWEGSDAAHAAKHQALVFQKPILLRRSVYANIAYPLRIAGVLRDPEIDARVEDALKLAGLEHIADRPAKVLSGGEQQKLALARARAQRPEVLFLDEPTANLDPRSLTDVEALIRALHDAGTKIIMTSHDMAQVKRLADEIVFIYDGRIVEAGPAEKVLRSRHIKY
jgi:tungstate transport system ATP-binding protein